MGYLHFCWGIRNFLIKLILLTYEFFIKVANLIVKMAKLGAPSRLTFRLSLFHFVYRLRENGWARSRFGKPYITSLRRHSPFFELFQFIGLYMLRIFNGIRKASILVVQGLQCIECISGRSCLERVGWFSGVSPLAVIKGIWCVWSDSLFYFDVNYFFFCLPHHI